MKDTAGNPVGFLVYEERCEQCLFSPNKIVDDKRRKEVLADCAKKDTYFICHKASMKGEDVCCKGFYETQDTRTTRMAKWLGVVRFVPLPIGDDL